MKGFNGKGAERCLESDRGIQKCAVVTLCQQSCVQQPEVGPVEFPLEEEAFLGSAVLPAPGQSL